MKNFEVDKILITGEAPVLQSDLGIQPNQIPLNKDLGSLAYMDAPQLEDVNVDTLKLREMAAEISDDIVDVFIYDTNNDSDGGKWRERTSHTSWYNEELNTATRGGRREFPAVAVIVAEELNVTIYDGDDPDLPMWMVFIRLPVAGGNSNLLLAYNRQATACEALNGQIFVSDTVDLGVIDFLKDKGFIYGSQGLYDSHCVIADRNELLKVNYKLIDTGLVIKEGSVNDVATTVLPNAPIDSETGLPVPTIAVATDGGVSVIRDDGSVISTQSSTQYRVHKIDLQSNSNLFAVISHSNNNNYAVVWANNYTNISGLDWDQYSNWNNVGGFYYRYVYSSSLAFVGGGIDATYAISDITTDSIGGLYGLTKTDKNPSDFDAGMVNYTTSSYNTGWMPGDIKLATLSDTKNETVGVDETTELVTNGTFNSNATGWSGDSSGVISWNPGGFATVTNTADDHTYAIRQTGNNNLQPGQNYILSVRIRPTFTGSYKFRVRVGSPEVEIYSTTTGLTSGQWTTITTSAFKVNAESVNIELGSNTEAAGITQFDIDDISITKTGELITNGAFDNGSEGWDLYTVGVGSIEHSTDPSIFPDGAIKIVEGAQSPVAKQLITGLQVGKKYVVSTDVYVPSANTVDFAVISVDNDSPGLAGSSETWVQTTIVDAVHNISFMFEATDENATVYLSILQPTVAWGIDGDVAYFDNISVRLAEDDRSVNDNGLQIFGEITKSPVASGADLVAYSGFSADNYLMQPYNSDLLDIDSHAVIGWCKVGSTTTEQTFLTFKSGGESAYGPGDTWTLMGCSADGSLFVQTLQNGTSNFLKNGIVENTGSWHHFCFIVSDSELVIYKDGVFIDSEPRTTSGSLYLSDSELRIGVRRSSSNARIPAHATSLSLMRLSTTIPTAEQIAKIYHDEKVLFQDGAQATLYGTSDAVTALAYDDKTKLLHVGTASGRSDFNGLRRVNNTTTAVTTAISANNKLIAEQ